MTTATALSTVTFQATVEEIEGSTILRLPEDASRQLPSRGQVSVQGTIDGRPFGTVVEPDGEYGHWIKLDGPLARDLKLTPGDSVALEIEPTSDWPEPVVPDDLQSALHSAPADIQAMWDDITPMSRWEWVRWVNATPNPDTRRRRVEVTISKMDHGKRRPCCFNRSACTDPHLSKNGKLRPPS